MLAGAPIKQRTMQAMQVPSKHLHHLHHLHVTS